MIIAPQPTAHRPNHFNAAQPVLLVWSPPYSLAWDGNPHEPIEVSSGGHGEPVVAHVLIVAADRFRPDLPDLEPTVTEAGMLMRSAARELQAGGW